MTCGRLSPGIAAVLAQTTEDTSESGNFRKRGAVQGFEIEVCALHALRAPFLSLSAFPVCILREMYRIPL